MMAVKMKGLVSIDRYNTWRHDTVLIDKRIREIQMCVQMLRTEIFKDSVYSRCIGLVGNPVFEDDIIRVNCSTSGRAWHLKFPTFWLGDPEWEQKAREFVLEEYDEHIMRLLER